MCSLGSKTHEKYHLIYNPFNFFECSGRLEIHRQYGFIQSLSAIYQKLFLELSFAECP